MTVWLDSDIVIEICRERDLAIVSKWRLLEKSDSAILCSPVTSAELWTGVRPGEHEAITNFFRTLVCVPIDYETGRKAGDYLRQYRRSHNLELGDTLIAAAAVLNRAQLWTRNRKHYPMKELSFY